MRATMLLIALAGLSMPAMATAGAPIARADVFHADGTPAGTAQLRARGKGAVLALKLNGVSAGAHGIHFHAVGRCDAPGFTTAGGHLNPAGRQHGLENPAGSHLGDLPNVTANAAGQVRTRVPLAIAPDALARDLFDADGAALVLHAGPDDYRTDPAGNSGARIACGVLSRP